MIRVIITGPPHKGIFPYRIEGHSSGDGIPIHGLRSHEPLLQACRILSDGGEPGDKMIGLFDEGSYRFPDWRMRTTVGYGSRYTVDKTTDRLRKHSPMKGTIGADDIT